MRRRETDTKEGPHLLGPARPGSLEALCRAGPGRDTTCSTRRRSRACRVSRGRVSGAGRGRRVRGGAPLRGVLCARRRLGAVAGAAQVERVHRPDRVHRGLPVRPLSHAPPRAILTRLSLCLRTPAPSSAPAASLLQLSSQPACGRQGHAAQGAPPTTVAPTRVPTVHSLPPSERIFQDVSWQFSRKRANAYTSREEKRLQRERKYPVSHQMLLCCLQEPAAHAATRNVDWASPVVGFHVHAHRRLADQDLRSRRTWVRTWARREGTEPSTAHAAKDGPSDAER